MAHDKRLVKHEDQIEELKRTIPDWIKNLKRPETPMLIPSSDPSRASGSSVQASSSHNPLPGPRWPCSALR